MLCVLRCAEMYFCWAIRGKALCTKMWAFEKTCHVTKNVLRSFCPPNSGRQLFMKFEVESYLWGKLRRFFQNSTWQNRALLLENIQNLTR